MCGDCCGAGAPRFLNPDTNVADAGVSDRIIVTYGRDVWDEVFTVAESGYFMTSNPSILDGVEAVLDTCGAAYTVTDPGVGFRYRLAMADRRQAIVYPAETA